MKKKIWIYPLILMGFVLILSTSCKKEVKIPELFTTEVSGITGTTAICGGYISGETDKKADITERGVCWSTSQTPTVSDNKTSDGTGSGSFTSIITGLSANTTYYVRAYATNSAGTGYGNTISFYTYAIFIGQSYLGGIVAYILQPDDSDYIEGQQHGLIAAPVDQSTSIQWTDAVSWTTTGATATALGTGNANTNTIVSIQGAGNYAAKLCYDLESGGYDDWYLPSKDELNILFLNQVLIGGFDNTTGYWSSSEFNQNLAWNQDFGTGGQGTLSTQKGQFWKVRAVRAF